MTLGHQSTATETSAGSARPSGRSTAKAGSPSIRTNSVVASYTSLLKTVRDAGLLRRRSRFYVSLLAALVLAIAGAATGFAFIGSSWFQLLIAAALGLLFAQCAFWAHEAAHNQVFASRRLNAWAGRIVGTALVGMSYAYWLDKHNRHHGKPNTIGKDPDIKPGVVTFHEEAAAGQHGLKAAFTRRQGWFLFPLLLFMGLALHFESLKFLTTRAVVKHRWVELATLALRFSLYLTAVFLLLPWGMGLAFIGVQLGVFGFYMGASFAPNHKGMPILASDSTVDFLSRQVLTSRNITGPGMTTLMGGLNYQIEHHLFPDMPRPNLPHAQQIVKEHCRDLDIAYTETSLVASYAIVVRYLNHVGLAASDPFDCPLASRYGK